MILKREIHDSIVKSLIIFSILFLPLSLVGVYLFYPDDKYERVVYAKGIITHKEILPYISGGKTPSLRDEFVMVLDDKKVQSVSKETYFTKKLGDYVEFSYMGINNTISKKELIIIIYILLFFEILLSLPLMKEKYTKWLDS